MRKEDVRRQQRFQNFNRAFLQLQAAMRQDNLNELEQNGLIQRFEFTIELAWNIYPNLIITPLSQFKQSFIQVPKVITDNAGFHKIQSQQRNQSTMGMA
jgi:hypothetical protein